MIPACIPTRGQPNARFLQSLQALRGVAGAWLSVGKPIEIARNELSMRALSTAATHALFIDDDMVFPPDALERLRVWDLPVVAGLYHERRSPFAPMLARQAGPAHCYTWMYEYERGKLVEVDGTGAGFILVARKVLEALGPHAWDPFLGTNAEDFSFCERARAAGFKVMVDTSLQLGHVSEIVVDDMVAEALRPLAYKRRT